MPGEGTPTQPLGNDTTQGLLVGPGGLMILERYAYPPPPAQTTTTGHLALFNQQLQKKRVEWIYADPVGGGAPAHPAPALSDPSSGVASPPAVDSPAPPSTAPPASVITRKKAARTSTHMWTVRVLVEGEYFGKGKGRTKKVARNEAAKEGLLKLGIVV